MTVSPATARQPSLITPLNSLLSVLDLTGEITDFTLTNTDLNNQHERKYAFFFMSAQGSAISISCKYCTLQDAGLGQEPVKCEKLCQPHQTGPQQEQRDCFLGSLSPYRTIVRRPEGQKCLSDLQMSRMWHTSACRVQTNTVSGLGSLGGWTLGSTNLEGGLHSPFPVKTKLDKEHYIS